MALVPAVSGPAAAGAEVVPRALLIDRVPPGRRPVAPDQVTGSPSAGDSVGLRGRLQGPGDGGSLGNVEL